MIARRSSLWLPVLGGAAAAILVAVLGGSMTDLGPWYQALKKPSWQPPGWLFGPAWTLIFALAAASGIIAWRNAVTDAQREWIMMKCCLVGAMRAAAQLRT